MKVCLSDLWLLCIDLFVSMSVIYLYNLVTQNYPMTLSYCVCVEENAKIHALSLLQLHSFRKCGSDMTILILLCNFIRNKISYIFPYYWFILVNQSTKHVAVLCKCAHTGVHWALFSVLFCTVFSVQCLMCSRVGFIGLHLCTRNSVI